MEIIAPVAVVGALLLAAFVFQYFAGGLGFAKGVSGTPVDEDDLNPLSTAAPGEIRLFNPNDYQFGTL